MSQKVIAVSSAFQKMTTQAILSIVFFLIVYVLLIVLGISNTILSAYAGFQIIIVKPALITFMIGAGLLSMGILILIFLFKFLFSKKEVDRSHLVEITENEEPKLFKLIHEIVQEVDTQFPKKVYLSSEVNACVFYDSSFWSMFLPVKKNLQIGMGLVNSVSDIEFKAILAHEFGHFSQRSMKVGSYVYNVNQIIFNMLYENDSYNSLIKSWGGVNAYFTFFVSLAVKIVEGIQWVLKQVYEVVNTNYLKMSREMEFHADEVAANVTGSSPLITSLLRLDLASHSYNAVLDYYTTKVPDAIVTDNLYPQQQFVMNFLAQKSKLPIDNNLPLVNIDHLSRYNKSKLKLNNQLSTHPSTEDRVAQLNHLNIVKEGKPILPARNLFSDSYQLEAKFTDKLFGMVNYETAVVKKDKECFVEDFTKNYHSNSFAEVFNGYYDNKQPVSFEDKDNEINDLASDIRYQDLFDDKKVDLVYTSFALENDKNTLLQIEKKEIVVKRFDYDGEQFLASESGEIVNKLEQELTQIKEEIFINDKKIFSFFLDAAKRKDKTEEFTKLYARFTNIDKDFDNKFDTYIKMINNTAFLYETTPFTIIEKNLVTLKVIEKEFKIQIQDVLGNDNYSDALSPEMQDNFSKYAAEDLVYFIGQEYHESKLEILFKAIHDYNDVLSKSFFKAKKEFLDFKSTLVA